MSGTTERKRNLTAKVRNAITELADEGKTPAQIASECGISVEKVEAVIAAAAEGKTVAEAAAAALAAAPEAPADGETPTPAAAPKPAKPKPVLRYRREERFVAEDGKVAGVRLFGVVQVGTPDETHTDLGVWGTTNDTGPAVDAYEKANKTEKFEVYLAVPQRFIWLVK